MQTIRRVYEVKAQIDVQGEGSEVEGQLRELSSKEEVHRRPRRGRRPIASNFNDFKVEIPEFEGKLVPDEFLEWLHTIERIF